MRLRDLDAQFVYDVQPQSFRRADADSIDGMQGVRYQCPACGAGKERGEEGGRGFIRGAHYILTLFSNPRGVAVAPAGAGPTDPDGAHLRWTIQSGSTLDDLTLVPSVDCTKPWKDEQGVLHPSACKFHGFVSNGDVS